MGAAYATGVDGPIGMFDSGFGGLTVARALIDLCPTEDLVYIGDTGRYPYGPRTVEEVRGFAHEMSRSLVEDYGVKMIVVACNTAAAAEPVEVLAQEFAIPVVGVIEPGARALVSATNTGRIGVIGTVGTVRSGSYQRVISSLSPSAQLTVAACPGLVEFVEKGETSGEQIAVLTERLLAPVHDAKVDALLLGCTHYPFLARVIAEVMGPDVVLVSSADETAFEVRSLLARLGMPRASKELGTHTWLSSGDTATFARLGRQLLGPELDSVQKWKPK